MQVTRSRTLLPKLNPCCERLNLWPLNVQTRLFFLKNSMAIHYGFSQEFRTPVGQKSLHFFDKVNPSAISPTNVIFRKNICHEIFDIDHVLFCTHIINRILIVLHRWAHLRVLRCGVQWHLQSFCKNIFMLVTKHSLHCIALFRDVTRKHITDKSYPYGNCF